MPKSEMQVLVGKYAMAIRYNNTVEIRRLAAELAIAKALRAVETVEQFLEEAGLSDDEIVDVCTQAFTQAVNYE